MIDDATGRQMASLASRRTIMLCFLLSIVDNCIVENDTNDSKRKRVTMGAEESIRNDLEYNGI